MTEQISPDEAAQRILSMVAVDHQLLARAKDATLKRVLDGNFFGHELIPQVVTDLGVATPSQLRIDLSIDVEPQLKAVSETLSARAAVCEALWGLIYAGLLVIGGDGGATIADAAVTYSTSHGAGGLDLAALRTSHPTTVLLAPSLRTNPYRSLSDGDLYLRDIGIASLHELIEESLRDAVRCFRSDLYLPAAAMLGRAVEMAWTELGLALAAYGKRNGDQGAAKLQANLVGDALTMAGLFHSVAAYYKRHPLFDSVRIASGVRDRDIDAIVAWSETVRDSRNVIHPRAVAATPNTYEKVAVLLLAAIPNLRQLYRARDAAK